MTSPWQQDGIRAAMAHGLCHPPQCGGSLRPWAPLIVPPKINGRALDILLPALCAFDEDYLKEHPDTPPLYRSGVWYEAEPAGHEQWLTIPWILMRRDAGRGSDCEDLACWRVAELRVRHGEDARPIWSCREHNGKRVYHIRVQRAIVDPKTGQRRIEDPSANLGMSIVDPTLFDKPQWRGNPNAVGSWFETFITDGERT